MDRRSFLRSLVGGVAAAAAVRTWPFRVYSFPTDVKVYSWKSYTQTVSIDADLVIPQLIDVLNAHSKKYLTSRLEWALFQPSPIYEAVMRKQEDEFDKALAGVFNG